MGLPICAIDGPEPKRRRLDGGGRSSDGFSDTDDVATKDERAPPPLFSAWPIDEELAHDNDNDSDEASDEDEYDQVPLTSTSLSGSTSDASETAPLVPDNSSSRVRMPWRWEQPRTSLNTSTLPSLSDDDTSSGLPPVSTLRRRNAFRLSPRMYHNSDDAVDNQLNRWASAEMLRRVGRSSSVRSPPPPSLHLIPDRIVPDLSGFSHGGDTLSSQVAGLYVQGMVSAQEAAFLSRSGSEVEPDTPGSSAARTPAPGPAPDFDHQVTEEQLARFLRVRTARLVQIGAALDQLDDGRRMRNQLHGIDDPLYGPRIRMGLADQENHPADAHLGDLDDPRVPETVTMAEQPQPHILSSPEVPSLAPAYEPLGPSQERRVSFHSYLSEFQSPFEPEFADLHSDAEIDSDSNPPLPTAESPGHVSFGSVSFAAAESESSEAESAGSAESAESQELIPIEDTLVIPFTRSPSPYEYPASPASSIDFERRDYNRRRSRSLERDYCPPRVREEYPASDPEPDVGTEEFGSELRRSNSLPFSRRRQSVSSEQSEPESSMRRSRSTSAGGDRRVRFRLAVRFQ